jgi:hypothetical protein
MPHLLIDGENPAVSRLSNNDFDRCSAIRMRITFVFTKTRGFSNTLPPSTALWTFQTVASRPSTGTPRPDADSSIILRKFWVQDPFSAGRCPVALPAHRSRVIGNTNPPAVQGPPGKPQPYEEVIIRALRSGLRRDKIDLATLVMGDGVDVHMGPAPLARAGPLFVVWGRCGRRVHLFGLPEAEQLRPLPLPSPQQTGEPRR